MCRPRTAPARCCIGEDGVDAASVVSLAPEMEPLEGLTLLGGIAFLVPTPEAPILTRRTVNA